MDNEKNIIKDRKKNILKKKIFIKIKMYITYGNFLSDYINNSLFFEKIDKILYLHELEKQYSNPQCLIIEKKAGSNEKIFCFADQFYVIIEKENDKIMAIDVIVCSFSPEEINLIQKINDTTDVSANSIYYLLNTLLLFKKQNLKFYNQSEIQSEVGHLVEKINLIQNILQKTNNVNISYQEDKTIVDNLKNVNENLKEFILNVNPAILELNKNYTKEFVNNLFLG
jgi:hypothetical protein